jgi:hypothetical protein
MSQYREFPPEQRFIVQVWKWQTASLEEYGRCGTYEEAEALLAEAKGRYSTGRIVEVRKMFTDQY